MTPSPPLVIAHRGASGYRPEHTRSAYELAVDLGADAVEPDVVVSRDGVLVVRHENEISETTDVADRPEFAARRAEKTVDGVARAGWFTEDFTWAELATLRCRERLPGLRPGNASFDDTESVLRLRDVLDLVRAACGQHSRRIGVVLEIKHATYFGERGWDVAGLVEAELQAAGWAHAGAAPGALVVESFEATVLEVLRGRGVDALWVYLLEARGRPADLVAAQGSGAPTYTDQLQPAGLDAIAAAFDGVSVPKRRILSPGRAGPDDLVSAAHARGLRVFTWTCRPENAFLARLYRAGAKEAFGDYEAEWAALRDTGIDGAFVDHPDLGVRVFQA